MRALVKLGEGPGNLQVLEVPEPVPGPGEVKVRVAFCGVCGTDLRIAAGRYHMKPPVVLGHEVSGWVEAVGPGVTGVVPGDPVCCETIVGQCGVCPRCREGRPQLCPSHLGMGTRRDGGFAEYVVVPEANAYPLPRGITLEEGALVEPLACAVRAVRRGREPSPGSKVLVTGPGPIGLLVTRLCALAGATVAVTGLSRDGHRLKKAADFAASYSCNVEDPGSANALERITGGEGFDTVYECAGGDGRALATALALVRRGGTVVQVGVIDGEPALPLGVVVEKEISLLGTKSQTPDDWLEALDLIADGRVALKP
ncbi:MAG: alcohol dehydrogenase catalytic domain-containing protein, partial [Firmicutes bacterium]|nr:alcohol dehydrogenase catalytic domain-containing protein [Bacillota bacterium]